MYKQLVRPILFTINPERIHELMIRGLKVYARLEFLRKWVRSSIDCDKEPVNILGIKFRNRIGLSSGFDKNGEVYNELADFGFGFIEIGTITPSPQIGNPKPRLFRLPKYDTIISRTGFNNQGLQVIKERLGSENRKFALGVNINKDPLSTGDSFLADFLLLYNSFYPDVDYFTINLTYPIDPTFKIMLDQLNQIRTSESMYRPVFLKLSPDLTSDNLLDILSLIDKQNIEGVIATGPTMDYSGIRNYTASELEKYGQGGVSGKGAGLKSLETIKFIRKNGKKDLIIVGAGGVMSYSDASLLLDAGADLIQIYSAFIFSGPFVVKELIKA